MNGLLGEPNLYLAAHSRNAWSRDAFLLPLWQVRTNARAREPRAHMTAATDRELVWT